MNAGNGLPVPFEVSVAKVFANEMAKKVSDQAMQLHGGNGYSEEFGIERLHRDAHGWAIAGGTPAIQRTRIAAELLGRTFSQRRARGHAVTDAPSFELTAPYLALQSEARALAASCADIAARADEADRFDPDIRQRLAASGLVDVVVAARYGGRYETVDSLAVTVVREAFAFESAHLDSMFAMQGIGSFVVSRPRLRRGPRHLAAAGRQPRRHRRPRAHRAGRRLRPARDHDQRGGRRRRDRRQRSQVVHHQRR